MRTADQITTVEIYWDTTNPGYEGWDYRVRYHDGHEETGAYDGVHDADDGSELVAAVQEIGWDFGLDEDDDIDAGAVAVENVNGGHAVWTRA